MSNKLDKKKSTAGAKTKYKKEYDNLAFNYCLLGSTDSQLAVFFGVSESTIDNWKKDHASFLGSLKAGKAEADAQVANALFHRAKGYSHPEVKFATFEGEITDEREYTKHYPPDTGAAVVWLANRQPTLWRKDPKPAEDESVETKPVKVIIEVADASRDKV